MADRKAPGFGRGFFCFDSFCFDSLSRNVAAPIDQPAWDGRQTRPAIARRTVDSQRRRAALTNRPLSGGDFRSPLDQRTKEELCSLYVLINGPVKGGGD